MIKRFSLTKGTEVEVYVQGSVYRGIVAGSTETEVLLKTPTRTWALPFDRIQSLKPVPKRVPTLPSK